MCHKWMCHILNTEMSSALGCYDVEAFEDPVWEMYFWSFARSAILKTFVLYLKDFSFFKSIERMPSFF